MKLTQKVTFLSHWRTIFDSRISKWLKITNCFTSKEVDVTLHGVLVLIMILVICVSPDGRSCCPWCTKTFSNLRVLLDHWKHCKSRQHLQDSLDSSSVSDSDTTGSFDYGDKNSDDDSIALDQGKVDKARVNLSGSTENLLSCAECKITFKSLSHLWVHKQLHLRHDEECSCPICEVHFSSNSDLYAHLTR